METGYLFDIQRFCMHDGAGIRTTVFFKGCPLRCRWCHNPESQEIYPQLMLRPNLCMGCLACKTTCPEGAIHGSAGVAITDRRKCKACGACVEACYPGARELVGREWTTAEVLAEIEKDIPFYDESGGGVTFSGGEALMQPAFLLELLQGCRERGIHTTLDTSGFAPWRVFERLRPYVRLFLYDVKSLDPALHREYTGVSNRLILSNLQKLAGLNHEIIVRLPLVPGVNDQRDHLRRLGGFVSTLPGVRRLDLLPYHASGAEKYARLGLTYNMNNVQSPSPEMVAEAVDLLSCFNFPVQIGG